MSEDVQTARADSSPRSEAPPRLPRSPYLLAYLRRRRGYVFLALGLAAVIAVLLVLSWPQQNWLKNLSMNLSADLIGTIVVLYAIDPYRSRTENQGDQVRDAFDRGGFIRQAADARRQIQILELWTDMLQESLRERFLDALHSALKQQVVIRILLLNPDGAAAEQRADDLRQQTDVVGAILDNLRIFHDFVYGEIPEVYRRNIDVRVYSALPPVQMYQVDTQVTVSFYPVSVTSWNATQYLTSTESQMGKFVGDKFEELWRGRRTRTLEQFWDTTVIVRGGKNGKDGRDAGGVSRARGGDERRYQVRFVTLREEVYVSGRNIIADHAEHGISGVIVHTVDGNVTGEPDERGPFSLVRVDGESEPRTYAELQDLFQHKYGVKHHVFLKLAEPVVESAAPGSAGPSVITRPPWRRGS